MVVGRRHWWLVIVLSVALIDIVGRFVLRFAMGRVIVFESALFLGACVLVAVGTVKYPSKSERAQWIERALAVVFGLAGLRVMVWAAGGSVGVAKMVVLGVGLMVALWFVIRARYLRTVRKT